MMELISIGKLAKLREVNHITYMHKIEQLAPSDRFYASSKICSCCGNVKKDLKLRDRVYKCNKCGNVIDRDYNASINLANYKLA